MPGLGVVFICNLMRICRLSELSVDSVCQEDEVMRDADSNETPGKLGSALRGTLVGRSYQYNICSGWVHAKCSGLSNAAQDPASPQMSTMNDEITKAISDHKTRQWREFVESIDQFMSFLVANNKRN